VSQAERTYTPNPITTDHVELPTELVQLMELLAENAHEVWARQRMAQGWQYGSARNDELKTHPCLIPYADLPDSEKVYDRNMAAETLRVIVHLGYRIQRAGLG